jgi:hypothetical protein
MGAQYAALAQQGPEKRASLTDFIAELLGAERESRRARAREMFACIAGFPANQQMHSVSELELGAGAAVAADITSATIESKNRNLFLKLTPR